MAKSAQAFRTIREVADWLEVPAHVLRFWESKFSQIKPVKRAGGRRYYRPADMELVGGIKVLLHDRGMTIRGVQKMISDDGISSVAALSPMLDGVKEDGTILDLDATEAWETDAEAEIEEAQAEPPETVAQTDALPPDAADAAPPDASSPDPAPLDAEDTPSFFDSLVDPDPEPKVAAASAPQSPDAPTSTEPPESDTAPDAAPAPTPEPIASATEPEPTPTPAPTPPSLAADGPTPQHAPEPAPEPAATLVAASAHPAVSAAKPTAQVLQDLAGLSAPLAALPQAKRAQLTPHLAALQDFAARLAAEPGPPGQP